MTAIINPELEALQDKSSRYEVLAWLNRTLQTKFTNMEEISSGMCFVLQQSDA